METIKSSAEISSLFKKGVRSSNRFITLIAVRKIDDHNPLEHGPCGRVAFIAGKKNGNACWRNAAKRRMREIARQIGAPWVGYDVLFIAKRGITSVSYSKVLEATKDTMSRADLGKLSGE